MDILYVSTYLFVPILFYIYTKNFITTNTTYYIEGLHNEYQYIIQYNNITIIPFSIKYNVLICCKYNKI